jgi:hypothetical protein
MSLPVLRVRHHSVIGGRDGDVLACASVGPAGEVAAVWTTPEGLGPVTSTTVSAAGAWFPDPAAARPVAARITVHTPDLAAVTRIVDRAVAHTVSSAAHAQRVAAKRRIPVTRTRLAGLVSLAGAASNSTDSLLTGSGVLPDSFPLEPDGVT